MSNVSEKPELSPWKRRPWPKAGDTNDANTYAAVGRALSAWERFESSLSLLFSVVVGDEDKLISLRAYCAVRTFEARCEMLKSASTAYFDLHPNKELENQFRDVIRSAKNFSPTRNEIAHGVVTVFKLEGEVEIKEPVSFCLVPSYAQSLTHRNLKFMPLYCYCVPELNFYTEQFNELDIRALDLIRGMIDARPTSGGRHP